MLLLCLSTTIVPAAIFPATVRPASVLPGSGVSNFLTPASISFHKSVSVEVATVVWPAPAPAPPKVPAVPAPVVPGVAAAPVVPVVAAPAAPIWADVDEVLARLRLTYWREKTLVSGTGL